MAGNRKMLGDLLIEAGVITQAQLETALALKGPGERIGDVFKREHMVSDKQVMEVLEFQLGVPFIELLDVKISPEALAKVPATLARRHELIPLAIESGKLQIAMEDPLNFQAIEDIHTVSGMEVVPMLAPRSAIEQRILEVYGQEFAEQAIKQFQRETAGLEDMARDLQSRADEDVNSAPIVRLLNSLIDQAVQSRASDIHVEPLEESVRMRLRIDGRLRTVLTVPQRAHAAILTRIKIMGDMNIAEKRLPQDGRYEIQSNGRDVDIRISTMPTVFGEKAVLRLLDRSNFLMPKQSLGFTDENMERFDKLLKNPHGIILVTGPTGSGKSTTLYSMMHEVNGEGNNIVTVEDPVEYYMAGLNQVQVNDKAGLTFANCLRSILRQDPNIIMIGEIRDSETAEIALRAAITGHLVLSTLHTNDAISTVSRLLDMGMEPYMLAAALVGIISQRLVRRICPECREEYVPSNFELEALRLPVGYRGTLWRGRGCTYCNNTGYYGRMAVHEMYVVDRQHRDMISRRATSDEMRDLALRSGMSTLRDEALKLMSKGLISSEEVISVAFTQEG